MSAPLQPIQSGIGRRYELLSPIGSGGFGEVWRGRLIGESGFAKMVAIKLLRAEGVRPAEIGARLRDEARLLALLRHRAIVHVDDLVRIDGAWAVVMELVDGADLGELLLRAPLPSRAVCEIATEVASALSEAHGAVDPQSGRTLGIIHRDIKPQNIRVSPKGEVKVLDFGIARASFDQRESVTMELSFGSPGYIAPERLDFHDSPAADVYALGIVVMECLLGGPIGRLPVSITLHDAEVNKHIRGVREVVGDRLGAPLGDLLVRMLAHAPEARPTADDLEGEFQDLVTLASGPWLKRWAAESILRRTWSMHDEDARRPVVLPDSVETLVVTAWHPAANAPQSPRPVVHLDEAITSASSDGPVVLSDGPLAPIVQATGVVRAADQRTTEDHQSEGLSELPSEALGLEPADESRGDAPILQLVEVQQPLGPIEQTGEERRQRLLLIAAFFASVILSYLAILWISPSLQNVAARRAPDAPSATALEPEGGLNSESALAGDAPFGDGDLLSPSPNEAVTATRARAKTARVFVSGEGASGQVMLRSPNGREVKPGAVEPGTYTVILKLVDSAARPYEANGLDPFTVRSGEHRSIRCDLRAERCFLQASAY